MQKKMLKSFYLLLALMLVFSLNSVAFAQTGGQQGGNQQGQDPQQDQNEGDDNDQQDVNQQQIGAQQGGTQQGAQQGQQFGAQQGGQQGTQQQGITASGACLQTYTIQQGDTLGDIANRFLGSIESYQLIVDATNAAVNNNQQGFQQGAQQGTIQQDQQGTIQQGQQSGFQQGGVQFGGQQEGQQGTQQQSGQQFSAQQGGQQGQQSAQQQSGQQFSAQQGGQQGQQGAQQQSGQQFSAQQGQQGGFQFTRIDDPNLIEVGQTLCIPSQQGFAQGQSTFQQGDPSVLQPTGNQNQQQGMIADLFTIPQGKSKILFENLSSRDLIVDISQGPTPQSMWVGPGQQHVFVVDPGQYTLTAHEPAGDFSLIPGQLQLVADTVLGLACQEDARCQAHAGQELMAMIQQNTFGQGTGQGAGQQGTLQQGTGQQQGTIQQGQPGTTVQPGTGQGTQPQQGTDQSTPEQGTDQQQQDSDQGSGG